MTERAWVPALACAGLFLIVALPRLQEPGFNHEEAFQALDALAFADPAAAEHIHGGYAGRLWFKERLPWMTLPYLGAPKVYLYAAAFRLLGPRWEIVRALTVALGALALVFIVLLAAGLYGLLPAAGLGLWIATDPAYWLIARHDYGPCMFTMAFKMAGLYFLWRGARQDSRRWVFLGAFLSGLCLWDKVHFLWWVAGVALAAALCWPRELLARRRLAPALAAGFLLGAGPFVLYNIAHPLDSFFYFDTIRKVEVGSWMRVALEAFPARCFRVWQTFSGGARYQMVSGVEGPMDPSPGAALLVWLAACAAALAWNRRRGVSLRPAAFWIAVACGILALAFTTPLEVKEHHLILLYPLPYLAVAALAADTLVASNKRFAAVLWIGLLAVGAARHLRTLHDFRRDVARTGGAPQWYMGFQAMARLVLEQGRPVLTTACMDPAPLILYTAGRVRVDTTLSRRFQPPPGAPAASGGGPAALPSGALLLARAREYGECPGDSEAARFVEREARRPGSPLVSVARIPYSDGSPWAEVYRVR